MDLQVALREAPTFVRNGQDTAARSPVNADTLYLWDNQVQAIEQFLAETEELAGQDGNLAQTRKDLLEIRKQIQLKVLEFELKAEGQELPPEPTEEEQLEELLEFGKDVAALLKKLEKAAPKSVEDIKKLDDERATLDSFLVDTESLQGKNKEMDALRTNGRAVKKALDARIAEALKAWRASDADEGDED